MRKASRLASVCSAICKFSFKYIYFLIVLYKYMMLVRSIEDLWVTCEKEKNIQVSFIGGQKIISRHLFLIKRNKLIKQNFLNFSLVYIIYYNVTSIKKIKEFPKHTVLLCIIDSPLPKKRRKTGFPTTLASCFPNHIFWSNLLFLSKKHTVVNLRVCVCVRVSAKRERETARV